MVTGKFEQLILKGSFSTVAVDPLTTTIVESGAQNVPEVDNRFCTLVQSQDEAVCLRLFHLDDRRGDYCG
jgi:hypothetical protein